MSNFVNNLKRELSKARLKYSAILKCDEVLYKRRRIMLIGEAPGVQEEKLEKPFVGASGRLLNSAIEKSSLTVEEFLISNAVFFRPQNESGKTMPPSLGNIKRYLPFLTSILDHFRPNHIIAIGKVAKTSVDLMDVRIRSHFLYHPAFYLRRGKGEDFINAFKEVVETIVKIQETE